METAAAAVMPNVSYRVRDVRIHKTKHKDGRGANEHKWVCNNTKGRILTHLKKQNSCTHTYWKSTHTCKKKLMILTAIYSKQLLCLYLHFKKQVVFLNSSLNPNCSEGP